MSLRGATRSWCLDIVNLLPMWEEKPVSSDAGSSVQLEEVGVPFVEEKSGEWTKEKFCLYLSHSIWTRRCQPKLTHPSETPEGCVDESPDSENVVPGNEASQLIEDTHCWSPGVGEQIQSQRHPGGGGGAVSWCRLEAFLEIAERWILEGRGGSEWMGTCCCGISVGMN